MNITILDMETLNHEHFNKKFSSIIDAGGNVVPYYWKYSNGTGYFDSAVELVKLDQGEEAVMIDNLGRKCILIGTLFGTVIVFQRHAAANSSWACNYPQELRDFGLYHGVNSIPSNDPISMYQLLGDVSRPDNVGEKLKKLLQSEKVREYIKAL